MKAFLFVASAAYLFGALTHGLLWIGQTLAAWLTGHV
jgi:hypothetical protein